MRKLICVVSRVVKLNSTPVCMRKDASWFRRCLSRLETASMARANMPIVRAEHLPSCVVLMLSTYVLCAAVQQEPIRCEVNKNQMSCDHDIPTCVPHNITDVRITDYNRLSPITIPRNGDEICSYCTGNNGGAGYWSHVEHLDIVINPDAYDDLDDGTFAALHNLRYLGIHGRLLGRLGTNVFSGLNKLEVLDLSGCQALKLGEDILPSLNVTALPHLKELNLNRIESRFSGNQISVDETFIAMLMQFNITKLHLGHTDILVKFREYPNTSLPIQELYVADITLMFANNLAGQHDRLDITFGNLKTLNISYVESRYGILRLDDAQNLVVDLDCESDQPSLAERLENLFADGIAAEVYTNSINNVTFNLSECELQLKRLHFKSNNLIKLNATVTFPKQNILTELDLSDNKMTFMSPKFINGLLQLKYLFLTNNKLNQMELKTEFGDLVRSLTKLEHFSIAANGLTYIPMNMFETNRNLRILELQRNNLATITFDMTYLINLERLDLSGNKIKYLEPTIYNQLTYLLNMNNESNSNPKLIINLESNPFECSCASADFLTWIRANVPPPRGGKYVCKLEDESVELNADTIEQARYLCYRTTIVISATVSTAAIIIIIVVVIYVIVRRRRMQHRKDARTSFIKAFTERTLNQGDDCTNYLAFLSYCSEDEKIAVTIVRQQLENTFATIINKERDAVCIGARHFRPGFPVIGEIMRCMSESCVAIFIVSRSFCVSEWCGIEVKEAFEQGKPIILIFTELVDERCMSSFVRRVFQRYTRAKLLRQDDQYTLEPTWACLCESVVMLAADEFQKTKYSNSLP